MVELRDVLVHRCRQSTELLPLGDRGERDACRCVDVSVGCPASSSHPLCYARCLLRPGSPSRTSYISVTLEVHTRPPWLIFEERSIRTGSCAVELGEFNTAGEALSVTR